MTDFESANRSLFEAFRVDAARHPEARVIVASQTRGVNLPLADVMQQGERFGAHLARLGVGRGDVVAVQLPAWSEWLIACVGIAHVGGVLLPIVATFGAKELDFILRQSKAKAIVTPDVWRKIDYPAVISACAPKTLQRHIVIGEVSRFGAIVWDEVTAPVAALTPVQRAPDDVAMLVYTSGTTADPKGVQHSSRSLLSELVTLSHAHGCDPSDVTLSPWPPGHVAGACSMMRFLVDGMPLVLMDQWDPAEAAELVERHRVSTTSFTPFHLAGLLDAADRDGRDLSSLRSVAVGGTPVPPSLITRCVERGLNTYRAYGSSEMPSVSSGVPSDPMDKRIATDGRPMLGAEVRLIDEEGRDAEEGELAVRGPELFIGYTDPALNEAAFLPGGWFRTGDVGRFDADGFLQITDRKKDIIIRCGENISSREVEDVLLRHPQVLDVAIVAAPDARTGELACAFVVLRPGGALTLDAVRAHFATAGIAKHKTPERLVIVQELPRNSSGKTLKHELRARLKEMPADSETMQKL
jgi:acyl-CoA synthetase (AMP-forming)/AMP-acid ligase II